MPGVSVFSFAVPNGVMFAEPPAPGERPARSFGPDATPRGRRKPGGRGGKGERVPKQPIREKPGGRFFGDADDETADDDLSTDNFASRVEESEDE